MSVLALTGPVEHSRMWVLIIDIVILLCVALSFVRVLSYTIEQVGARRMIDGVDAPARFDMPPLWGSLFAFSVVGLFLAQSIMSYLVVVFGLAFFLAAKGRTASYQFGLNRLPAGRTVAWSFLVCGAVIFCELPLERLVDWAMTAIHLPHPEQESVEFFRRATRPAVIFAFLIQAVILSPLIEELFFRGFLFAFLKNYTTTAFALVLSAGVFAFVHANLGSIPELWVLGLVLGLAYEHSGSLFLPMGIHACWNFMTAMSLLFDKGGF